MKTINPELLLVNNVYDGNTPIADDFIAQRIEYAKDGIDGEINVLVLNTQRDQQELRDFCLIAYNRTIHNVTELLPNLTEGELGYLLVYLGTAIGKAGQIVTTRQQHLSGYQDWMPEWPAEGDFNCCLGSVLTGSYHIHSVVSELARVAYHYQQRCDDYSSMDLYNEMRDVALDGFLAEPLLSEKYAVYHAIGKISQLTESAINDKNREIESAKSDAAAAEAALRTMDRIGEDHGAAIKTELYPFDDLFPEWTASPANPEGLAFNFGISLDFVQQCVSTVESTYNVLLKQIREQGAPIPNYLGIFQVGQQAMRKRFPALSVPEAQAMVHILTNGCTAIYSQVRVLGIIGDGLGPISDES